MIQDFNRSMSAKSTKEVAFKHTGTCGKGDPMQVAPVYLCGPEVRMRNIRLG